MYNSIAQFVREDLSEYNERNRPLSKTVVNGTLWRHYELGPIYGFVLYNSLIFDKETIRIASITEDDGSWFAPEEAMDMDAFWLDHTYRTLSRTKNWYKCVKNGMQVKPEIIVPKFSIRESNLIISDPFAKNERIWFNGDHITILDYDDKFFQTKKYYCENLDIGCNMFVEEHLIKRIEE